MQPLVFSTVGIAQTKQLDAWRGWFDTLFEAEAADPEEGFTATSETWDFGGFGLSRVRAPKLRAIRTPDLIRRNPLDHWNIVIGNKRTLGEAGKQQSMDIPAGLPFITSLGRAVVSARDEDERLQLYLPRDTFPELGTILEKVEGLPVSGAMGRLLADFVASLSRNASALSEREMPNLHAALRGLIRACLAPSVEGEFYPLTSAPLTVMRMQAVTRLVDANLRDPSFSPDVICRSAGMSRSQLYRLLETEGGVRHFIQRRRLRRCHAELSKGSADHSVWAVAEHFGFTDPSSFSRSFKREFGFTPKEVRDARRMQQPALGLRVSTEAMSVSTMHELLRNMRCEL